MALQWLYHVGMWWTPRPWRAGSCAECVGGHEVCGAALLRLFVGSVVKAVRPRAELDVHDAGLLPAVGGEGQCVAARRR